ncbi:sulfotransferase domain-containing protein [Legionella israelensis]|nr:sulfotransferase domain-containing protein [Legionella israelensis]QBS10679.1 sulfotransferase [Legionella israelensis]
MNKKYKNVIWISGMPRSGTTWLSQIFASSPDVRLKFCPLFSYEFKNLLNEKSTLDEWEELFSNVYSTNSEYLDQHHLRSKGLVPKFINKKAEPDYLVIKSTRFHNLIPHLLRLHNRIRIIHIVRHPCAVIYSWLSNPHEFPETADPLNEWKTGQCRKNGFGEFWGFDDWKHVCETALELSKQFPKQHMIIRYEDLVKNPIPCIQKLFSYAGIILENQTIDFINLSQSYHDNHKHSVFKKRELKEKWEDHLDPQIVSACMNEIKGTKLEQFAGSV